MPYEVLVVDDKIAAGNEYTRLIRQGFQIEAMAVDDPIRAIEVLKQEPIKVVVLDQVMPVKGTDLYKQLKAIDNRIKVVMLSGEASTQDLDTANKLGYDDYLSKSRIKELPLRVHILYVKYVTDLLATTDGGKAVLLLTEKKGIWPFRERVDFYFTGAVILEEEYVFDDSWRTIKQISAGETVTETDTVEMVTKFKFQEATETKMGSSTSASVEHFVKLQSKIEAAVTQKFSSEVELNIKRQMEVRREYKLPEAPANPQKLHVASRHFQRAPVYRQIRVVVVRQCTSCGRTDTFPTLVYQPTPKIATRHLDYFSNGMEKILPTGCEKL